MMIESVTTINLTNDIFNQFFNLPVEYNSYLFNYYPLSQSSIQIDNRDSTDPTTCPEIVETSGYPYSAWKKSLRWLAKARHDYRKVNGWSFGYCLRRKPLQIAKPPKALVSINFEGKRSQSKGLFVVGRMLKLVIGASTTIFDNCWLDRPYCDRNCDQLW